VKPLGKVTTTESPALSAPVAVVLKLAVQFAVEPVVWTEPLKLTVVTAVAAAIVGDTVPVVAVSTLVCTVKVTEPAPGFVGVAIVSCTAVEALTVQVPPSVIVTTWPLPLADATVHVPKPLVSETVGDVGTVKPAGNVTVTESPALSAPLVFGGPTTVALVVKPIVQIERAPPVCGEPDAVTLDTTVFAAIVMLAAGAFATASAEVLTVQCEVA
jgi:hypothetical protein